MRRCVVGGGGGQGVAIGATKARATGARVRYSGEGMRKKNFPGSKKTGDKINTSHGSGVKKGGKKHLTHYPPRPAVASYFHPRPPLVVFPSAAAAATAPSTIHALLIYAYNNGTNASITHTHTCNINIALCACVCACVCECARVLTRVLYTHQKVPIACALLWKNVRKLQTGPTYNPTNAR